MSIAERIKVLAKFEGNQTKLAKKINSTSQSISKTISENRGVRTDTLEAIAKAYPQLNMRWFITGEGDSGLDEEVPEVPVEDPEKELLKEELLGVYKAQNKMLEEKVKMLEREIREQAPDLAVRLEIE